MKRKLFKGTFNWCGESYDLYTRASSLHAAWLNFTAQLSKKLGFSKYSVRQYFDGSKDNYYVEEVKDETN